MYYFFNYKVLYLRLINNMDNLVQIEYQIPSIEILILSGSIHKT